MPPLCQRAQSQSVSYELYSKRVFSHVVPLAASGLLRLPACQDVGVCVLPSFGLFEMKPLDVTT